MSKRSSSASVAKPQRIALRRKSLPGAQVTLINRSRWPDGFVRVVLRHLCIAAEIDWCYEVTVKRATHQHWYWRGMAYGDYRCHVTCHRRLKPKGDGWPCTHRDRRFQWSPEYTHHSPVGVFIHLLAHEVHHATPMGDRLESDGAHARSRMEHRCNQWADQRVQWFREHWSQIAAEIRKEIRRDRARVAKQREAQAHRRSAAGKREQVSLRLADWQERQRAADAKAKAAAKRVKELQRRLRDLDRQIERQAASRQR
jgi:hypothetical protein